ncbi:MAG: hypothetical protein IT323_23070, partial [Anaerolineae bacterium]|nr:hypothetical protein [Anaerolineae bacterium]
PVEAESAPPEPVAEAAAPEPVAHTPEPEAEPEFTWEPLAEMPPAEPPQAVPEPAADLSDFTGGMDPMAWLEALARRQGAPTDELVTGGTAEIPPEPVEAETALPEPVAEAAVPEPLEEIAPVEAEAAPELESLAEAPDAAPEPVEILDAADPLAWLSEVTGEASISLDALGLPGEVGETGEPEVAAPLEPAADLSEFTGGEDPLRWLESLAARQGASRDELVTSADLEIPVPAADAPVDGPGYSELDVFSVTAPGRAPGEIPEGVATPDAMSDADALAWLESLTGASQIDLSMLDLPPAGAAPDVTDQTMTAESALSWLESLAHETPAPSAPSMPAASSAPEPALAGEPGDRMAGGMSDDVDEVRAWLEAQARELEQTREQLESEEPYVAAEMPSLSDEPAVPGDVPDWLTSLHEASLDAAQAESPLVEDVALPDVPSDLPTWLTESQPGVDLESLELDEALPQAEVSPEPEAISLPTFSPDELEALTRPASPDDVDSWAEALDEEYNRRLAGDETIPDWYLDAIRRAEDEWTGDAALASAASEAAVLEGEPEPLIERDDIPDWLRASVPEAPAVMQGEDLSDVPPWLVEMSAGIDLPSAQPEPVALAPAPEEVRPPWLPPPNEAPAHAEPPAVEPVRPAMAAPPPAPPPPAPRPVQRSLPPSRYH